MGKQKFSTAVIDNTSYIGELALPYITAAFAKNKTVDSGIRVIEDIVYKAYVAKLSGSGLVQHGPHCNFTPAGTITAAEVPLIPCEFFIDLEICYQDLESIWNGLNSGNLNTQDPGADFTSALQKVVMDAMSTDFEWNLWNALGTITGGTGQTLCANFTGIPAQITTNTVTGVSALTASNIVAAVDALIVKLPSVVLENPSGMKIYMNPKTAMYYRQALMKLGINTPNDSPPFTYDGFPIYQIVQIPDNLMVAIQPQNIALGVGAMDNFSQLIIKDMRETTLDNKVRMKLQGKADIQVLYQVEAAKWYKV